MALTPYRMVPPLAPDPYARAWRDLARRHAITYALAVGCGIAALAGLVDHMVWPFGVAMGLWIGARLHLGAFVCPRCQSRFFRSGARGWAKCCHQCGIREGTPQPLELRSRGQAAAIGPGSA